MAMTPVRRKHLQRIYLQLLENITEHQKIIDDLHTRDVLSAQMKEKIECKQKTDRLRELLDILPKRGNEAFDHFYEVLVNCGEDVAADLVKPELAKERKSKHPAHSGPAGVQESPQPLVLPENDELPEKWPDLETHESLRVIVQNVADTDVQMKAEFQRAQSGNASVYAMCRSERGIFLLISNQFFKEARANKVELDDRDGTAQDCQALDALFKQLGFRVKKKFNLKAADLLQAIKDQASLDHTSYDCFACAVLTHGERDVVYGVDGKEVPLDVFKDAIDGNNCPTLIGKPKLFFIQACQGRAYDTGAGAGAGFIGMGGGGDPSKPSVERDQEMDKLASKLVGVSLRDKEGHDAVSEVRKSAKSDIFVAMATIPDFVSWRNTEFGTWFVQAIAYVFSHLAYKYTLDQLMTRVNRLVSKAETRRGLKQVSIFKSALTSDFYFFPGLKVEGMVESHSETDMNTKPAPPQAAEPSCLQQQAQPAAQSQQPASMGSSLTAQPTDALDGNCSRLVE